MARKKVKNLKEKKILIRVSKDEKALAEKLSRERGMNTSEFFRHLLSETQICDRLEAILKRLENVPEKA